jgi:hypothetical protein
MFRDGFHKLRILSEIILPAVGIIIRDHEGKLKLIAWRGFYFTAGTKGA